MEQHIHLYHINDLHSHFENWPKVVSFIQEERKRLNQLGEEMIVLDIGDHIDRFHPITEASLGKANIRLMNELGYDYVTIGNNEGITLSKEQLTSLYHDAHFEVLVANIFDHNDKRPSWLKPYALHQTISGLKIAFIGVTVSYEKYYELLGWSSKDPFEILPLVIKEVIEKGADYVVLLSHLGISDDEKLAREIEGIDVIIGGHTHHLLPTGTRVNNTTICAAGKFGMNVGHIKLSSNKQMSSNVIAAVYSVFDTKECLYTKKLIERESNKASSKLDKKITYLPHHFNVDWYLPSDLPMLLAEAIREWCQAEIGMVNAGVLLNSLPKGYVTIGDLHRICPHPINPCKLWIKGNELKEVVLQAATERMEKLEMKGFGFRGKVLGAMVYDGLKVETTFLQDGNNHVSNITVKGFPLQLDRQYEIATLDMFTFGSLYPEFFHAKHKQYFLPEMLRDLLRWKLEKKHYES